MLDSSSLQNLRIINPNKLSDNLSISNGSLSSFIGLKFQTLMVVNFFQSLLFYFEGAVFFPHFHRISYLSPQNLPNFCLRFTILALDTFIYLLLS